MENNRLSYLSLEIDIINAIINNDTSVKFNDLFVNDESASDEFKFEILCRIAQQILNSMELENEETLLNMFKEIYPNEDIGLFCIDFIKFNKDKNPDVKIDERINNLLSIEIDMDVLPESNIKRDYLNLMVTLLLNQEPLNIEFINHYNNEIKKLINK
jgi:DNA-directed RNA polymerase specialized sigma54-like protein